MFDIGWSEMAVIAVVALLVLGPKELPNALKTASHWLRTARKLAREFQSGVDQIVRDAELDEARKTMQQARSINVGREIEKVVDPTGETKRQLNQPEDSPVTAEPKATAPSASGSASLAAPTAAEAPHADQPATKAAAAPASGESTASPAGSAKPDHAPEPAAAGEGRG